MKILKEKNFKKFQKNFLKEKAYISKIVTEMIPIIISIPVPSFTNIIHTISSIDDNPCGLYCCADG